MDQKASDSERPASLNQDRIQSRMIYACRLVELASENKSAAVEEGLDSWYLQVAMNGLCGGWVEIYKSSPTWLEALWNRLAQWQPKGNVKNHGSRGKVVQEDLHSLEQALSGSEAVIGKGGALQVVRALLLAWRHMDRLEPTENYGAPPQWLSEKVSALPAANEVTAVQKSSHKRKNISPEDAVAWFTKTTLDETGILSSGPDVHYLAHLETNYHHMCVRLCRRSGTATIEVCETEETGIVSCTDQGELLIVLRAGGLVGFESADLASPKDEFSVVIFSLN